MNASTIVAEPADQAALLCPAADVWEDAETFRVTVELPGVPRADLEVEVRSDRLAVRGQKRPEPVARDGSHRQHERRYGLFYWAVRLPETIDPGRGEATLKE
jgi:HSP20 family protein